MNGDIVINWTIVAGVSVFLGFLFNQVFKYLAKRWPAFKSLAGYKKYVVFATSFLLSLYFVAQNEVVPPFVLDDPASWFAPLLVLGSMAGSAFKAAQKIYDVIGKDVLTA